MRSVAPAGFAPAGFAPAGVAPAEFAPNCCHQAGIGDGAAGAPRRCGGSPGHAGCLTPTARRRCRNFRRRAALTRAAETQVPSLIDGTSVVEGTRGTVWL